MVLIDSRRQFCKAYDKKCTKCNKLHHFAVVCRSNPQTAAVITDTEDPVAAGLLSSAGFYAMTSSPPTTYVHLQPVIASLGQSGPVTTVPLPHIVHSQHRGWLRQPAQPSPTVPMDIKIDRAAYGYLQLPVPRSALKPTRVKQVNSCADTGAQLTTVPFSLLARLGVHSSDLLPIASNLKHCDRSPC